MDTFLEDFVQSLSIYDYISLFGEKMAIDKRFPFFLWNSLDFLLETRMHTNYVHKYV